MLTHIAAIVLCLGAALFAQQTAAPLVPPIVAVKPIEPPAKPLPSEAATAGIKKFSFIAYGDTRSSGEPEVPGDGQVVHPVHSALVDLMVAKIKTLSSTDYPVRFVVQSGDAVLTGQNGAMWNVSFSPIIERLTRGAGIPYFFAAGNHDVGGMPVGSPVRALGLNNLLTAMSRLLPTEGSPRRLNGYPTYAFGYGNLFMIALDSNVAADPVQLAWVTDQLERLDRRRFPLVIALFHHPPFTTGPHGGPRVEPPAALLRELYLPLFRKHHVRMTITGHDHLLDHFVERFTVNGTEYRRDDVVTGGGGAPSYAYSGEQDLTAYLASAASQNVRVEHLTKPGPTIPDNPHHFVVVRVNGDKLSLEVVATGAPRYQPYGRRRIDLND
jgi:3',5'-cyclic AMP phosphodiesterase CpdA